MTSVRFSCLPFALMLCVLSSSCAHVHHEAPDSSGMPEALPAVAYHAATVVSAQKPPFFTGYVLSWIAVTAEVREGKRVELLIPYLDENTVVPRRGQLCDFEAKRAFVNGAAGDYGVNQFAHVVVALKCKDSNA